MAWYGIVYLLCIFHSTYATLPEKPIVVIIPSYNNIQWYMQNLDSIRMQKYTNYHVFYIDDCSTDGTADAVQAYVEQWHLEEKITIFRNPMRRGQLYNMYIGVHCCSNDVIVVAFDGDDFFAHEHVLSVVNEAYEDADVWLTYGQFIEYPSGNSGFCKEIPHVVKKYHSYRYYDWITSHLRTFYAGLFKEIPLGYFIKDGDFIRAACDHAFMFPLLELSGGRVAFIEDILYIYNMANVNNIFRKNPLEQITNAYWIRGREPLKVLTHNPVMVSPAVPNPVYNIHCSFGDVESCARYLSTIPTAGIDPETVTVWYDVHSVELCRAYTELCTVYGVISCMIDSTVNCKEQVLSYLATLPVHAMILLTSDGCTWTEHYNPACATQIVRQTKAKGYSYRGTADTSCGVDYSITRNLPQFVPLQNELWVWKYADSVGKWHQPYSVHATLYTMETIRAVITLITGSSVFALTQSLALIPAENPDDVGICSTHAACAYVPV